MSRMQLQSHHDDESALCVLDLCSTPIVCNVSVCELFVENRDECEYYTEFILELALVLH